MRSVSGLLLDDIAVNEAVSDVAALHDLVDPLLELLLGNRPIEVDPLELSKGAKKLNLARSSEGDIHALPSAVTKKLLALVPTKDGLDDVELAKADLVRYGMPCLAKSEQ